MGKKIKKNIDAVMGENLKRLRKSAKKTQQELADLIGTNRRYISAMEHGRGIGGDLLDRLCGYFKVSEDDFGTPSSEKEGGSDEEKYFNATIRFVKGNLSPLEQAELGLQIRKWCEEKLRP